MILTGLKKTFGGRGLLLAVLFLLIGNLTVSAATDGYYTYEIGYTGAIIQKADKAISGDVVIPSSLGRYPVVEIYTESFYGCREMTSVRIPNGVTKIGGYAFSSCDGLTSVTIPDSVTEFERGAFNGCVSLTSVTIPKNMTKIGDYAFQRCTSLTSVTIPNGVTEIGVNAFDGCDAIHSVYYAGTKAQWEEILIQYGNEALQNAKVYFEATGPVVMTLVLAKNGAQTNFTVSTENIPKSSAVMLALYKNGKFLDFQMADYHDRQIVFTTTTDYDVAKVMAWNDLESLDPICGVKTAWAQ